jgi:hypothetical protein
MSQERRAKIAVQYIRMESLVTRFNELKREAMSILDEIEKISDGERAAYDALSDGEQRGQIGNAMMDAVCELESAAVRLRGFDVIDLDPALSRLASARER